jgi:hypothetical protein
VTPKVRTVSENKRLRGCAPAKSASGEELTLVAAVVSVGAADIGVVIALIVSLVAAFIAP